MRSDSREGFTVTRCHTFPLDKLIRLIRHATITNFLADSNFNKNGKRDIFLSLWKRFRPDVLIKSELACKIRRIGNIFLPNKWCQGARGATLAWQKLTSGSAVVLSPILHKHFKKQNTLGLHFQDCHLPTTMSCLKLDT